MPLPSLWARLWSHHTSRRRGEEGRSGFPRPRGLCREGARPRERTDLGSSVPGATPLALRDRTPPRHFGVSCCGPGANRKRECGFRWLRDSHAHNRPPATCGVARARESGSVPHVRPILGSAPDAEKKRTVQVTESRAQGSPSGAAKEAVSCDRPRSRNPRLAACLASRLLLNRIPTAGGLFYREVRLVRTPISESHDQDCRDSS